jgi:hypothetical protein
VLCAVSASPAYSQEKSPDLPAQIELLETRVRFESNGDSRKEVHTRVHINNELGARQFARLSFDYNRSFQQIEFPLVRVTHEGGGTVDILPTAISDNPNPAVVNAPAYQDVRVKSLRILGLAPNDLLEYRVVTTTSHHPLAPDFWLDHTFDRSGVTANEIFELNLPAARQVAVEINPSTPADRSADTEGSIVYRWHLNATDMDKSLKESSPSRPDVLLSSFADWGKFADRLNGLLKPSLDVVSELFAKVEELEKVSPSGPAALAERRAEAFYNVVSQKIRTVDLPLGSTGFKTRDPLDTLISGYGTPEDKYVVFAALAQRLFGSTHAGLIPATALDARTPPSPAVFGHLLTMAGPPSRNLWLELNAEVAPYRVIPSQYRGRKALLVGSSEGVPLWHAVTNVLPFRSAQNVKIDASLSNDGSLNAKVKYVMRGDNELLLRVAFHQSPKEKWNEVAQLLALSDGFRGKITNVTASDPYSTKTPFTVEYEITQPKFVDWSKKPVRVPALLPQLGLPDPPAKPASGAATSAIDLGTPLDVDTHLTLHLPAGTVVRTPAGTSIVRDYATFASNYHADGAGPVTASRHLNFLSREIPADRAADYNAFARAVQNDESQEFTLEPRQGTHCKRAPLLE